MARKCREEGKVKQDEKNEIENQNNDEMRKRKGRKVDEEAKRKITQGFKRF